MTELKVNKKIKDLEDKIDLIKEDLLLPFNKLWMRLGFFLGKIISPIILGIIFFFIFTPIAYGMRIFNRDELNLKFGEKISHWKNRSKDNQPILFKNQF